MEEITGTQNERVKLAVKLRNSASQRKESSLFLLEGARLCADAALTGAGLTQLFFTRQASEKYPEEYALLAEKSERAALITSEVAAKLSDTVTPQGIFCVFKTPDTGVSIDKINIKGKYIALESIQDPSNLGAICRTAEALGIDGAIMCGCCDIYNPKAQRAAMGSLLRLPVLTVENLPETLGLLAGRGMKIYGSTPSEEAEDITRTDKKGGVVCVIGNEGNGISEQTALACSGLVRIPMLGRAESLNAATAAAIIMWELLR